MVVHVLHWIKPVSSFTAVFGAMRILLWKTFWQAACVITPPFSAAIMTTAKVTTAAITAAAAVIVIKKITERDGETVPFPCFFVCI